jgi:hypothetical protein
MAVKSCFGVNSKFERKSQYQIMLIFIVCIVREVSANSHSGSWNWKT